MSDAFSLVGNSCCPEVWLFCFRLGLREGAKATEKTTPYQSVRRTMPAVRAASLGTKPSAMLAVETIRAATATRKAKTAELVTATRTTHAAGATQIAKFIGTPMVTSRGCATTAAT